MQALSALERAIPILEMFAEVAGKQDDYKKFYEHFGKCLKLGVHEELINCTKVAELLWIHTHLN